MTRRLARLMVGLCLATSVSLLSTQRAGATIGPYTLPFFSAHTMTQDYGPTSVTTELPGHGYAHWHNGIDWAMPIGTAIAASNLGTVGHLKEDLYDGQTDQYGQGNYVFVSHAVSPARWSLYYHLTHNGVLFATGTNVSAGQQIAISGNTGQSSGPHLHYSLMTTDTCQSNSCDADPRQWTTNPGRVPWLASYYSESNGGDEYIQRYTTTTHWVRFKNIGGRTWTTGNDPYGRGRIFLAATNGAGTATRNSSFQASDWSNAWLVSPPDLDGTGPDENISFTFGLYAAPPQGVYIENFNLRANALWWFDYDTLGDYYIPIHVYNKPPG